MLSHVIVVLLSKTPNAQSMSDGNNGAVSTHRAVCNKAVTQVAQIQCVTNIKAKRRNTNPVFLHFHGPYLSHLPHSVLSQVTWYICIVFKILKNYRTLYSVLLISSDVGDKKLRGSDATKMLIFRNMMHCCPLNSLLLRSKSKWKWTLTTKGNFRLLFIYYKYFYFPFLCMFWNS